MTVVYILIAGVVLLLTWLVIALIWGKPWSIKSLYTAPSCTLP
jgi:hypothetical protein